jgi:hypothetical protein
VKTSYIYDNTLLNSSCSEKCLSQSCSENHNTHCMFNNVFPKSCRLWDNVEKSCTAGEATDDDIIRRMRNACYITKATDNTFAICNIYYFSTATVVMRTRLNVTFIRTLPILFIFNREKSWNEFCEDMPHAQVFIQDSETRSCAYSLLRHCSYC